MKKKLLKILAILLIIPISFLSIKYVKADSGWDTSYDSGGSWDSGSSWDSSSSYDDWGSSDSSIDSDYAIYIVLGIILIIIIVVIIETKRSNSNLSSKKIIITDKNGNIIYNKFPNSDNNVSKTFVKKSYTVKDGNGNIIYNKVITDNNADNLELKDFINNNFFDNQLNKINLNFDIEALNQQVYKMFYDIQIAWMNFDYDKLKELLTDELYNTYLMDLEVLESKKQQNIMSDFKLINCDVFDLDVENGKYIAKSRLEVKFYDYIIDQKTNKILRGNKKRKVDNTYILTFEKSVSDTNGINECPVCGAPVEGNQTGVCEYCKSKLINEEFDWVLAKKEKISQK